MKGMYNMENEKKDNVDKIIDDIENKKNIYATGRITRVNKYNIEVTGLNDVSFYEAIDVAGKASGYIMGIYPSKVIVSLVEIKEEVVPGDLVYALKKEARASFFYFSSLNARLSSSSKRRLYAARPFS